MSNRIVYKDYAVGAKENASVDLENTDQQLIPHTVEGVTTYEDDYNVSSIFNENVSAPIYASFEGEGIPVDTESVSFYSSGDIGFVSDTVSDGNGTFATPPKLTIELSDGYYTGRGITLYFAGTYCSSLSIKYYHDTTLLDNSTYQNTSLTGFFAKTVSLYNKVVVEFISTQGAYQFAKVWRVDFGRDIVFDKFKNINHYGELNPFGKDLPISTLEFEVVSEEGLNFQDDQKILVYHGDELFDTLWITNSKKETNRIYSVTADNVFGRLDNTTYLGNVYETLFDDFNNAVTVKNDIQTQCGVTIHLDSSFNSKYIYGHLPMCTGRYAIAQFAFALGAIITSDENGEVYIKPIATPETIPIIDSSKILGEAKYTKNSAVTQVSLVRHLYDTNVFDQEAVGVVNISTTPVTVKFDKPVDVARGYAFKDALGNPISSSYGIEVFPFHPNYAVCYSTSSVSAYFYVNKYFVSQLLYSKVNTDLTSNAKENISEYNNYTLSTYTLANPSMEENATAFLDDLFDKTVANRGFVDVSFVLNGEKLGDIVSVETKYDGIITGVITKLDTDIGHNKLVTKAVIQEWVHS
jgi:hypothetical protein